MKLWEFLNEKVKIETDKGIEFVGKVVDFTDDFDSGNNEDEIEVKIMGENPFLPNNEVIIGEKSIKTIEKIK